MYFFGNPSNHVTQTYKTVDNSFTIRVAAVLVVAFPQQPRHLPLLTAFLDISNIIPCFVFFLHYYINARLAVSLSSRAAYLCTHAPAAVVEQNPVMNAVVCVCVCEKTSARLRPTTLIYSTNRYCLEFLHLHPHSLSHTPTYFEFEVNSPFSDEK